MPLSKSMVSMKIIFGTDETGFAMEVCTTSKAYYCSGLQGEASLVMRVHDWWWYDTWTNMTGQR
jgi:hypothetical protein